jgi:hypothetical protein
LVGEGGETNRVEALEPGPHGERGELELLRNRGHTVPLVRQTDDACAFDVPCCCGACVGSFLDRFLLFGAEYSEFDRQRHPS